MSETSGRFFLPTNDWICYIADEWRWSSKKLLKMKKKKSRILTSKHHFATESPLKMVGDAMKSGAGKGLYLSENKDIDVAGIMAIARHVALGRQTCPSEMPHHSCGGYQLYSDGLFTFLIFWT